MKGRHTARPRLALVHLSDTGHGVYRHDAVGLGTVPFSVVPPVLDAIGHAGLPVLETIAPDVDAQIEDSARRLAATGFRRRPTDRQTTLSQAGSSRRS